MSFKVSYDQGHDILYLAREGQEAEAVEVGPGIMLEFDAEGDLLGVEILRASQVLREVLKPLASKAQRFEGPHGWLEYPSTAAAPSIRSASRPRSEGRRALYGHSSSGILRAVNRIVACGSSFAFRQARA